MRILAGAPKPARAYLEDFGVKLQASEPVLFSSLGPKFDFSFGTRLRAIDVAYAALKIGGGDTSTNKTRVCTQLRGLAALVASLEPLSPQRLKKHAAIA